MKRRSIGLLGGALAVAALTALVTVFDAAMAQEGQERVVVRPEARAFSLLGGSGAFLGVTILEVDDARASEAGMSEEYGVYIEGVSEDGPAEAAGVEAGDVIVAWNGSRVEGVQQLQRLLGETPPGRTVRLTVMRDGSERTLSVELGDRGEARVFTMPRGDAGVMRIAPGQRFEFRPSVRGRTLERPDVRSFMISRRPRLGASIQSLGDQLAEYFGVDGGALVTSVSEDSPAAAAGLRAGDVIIGLAGETVEGPSDLLEILGDQEPGTVSMRIVRDGSERTLQVEIVEPGENDGEEEGDALGYWFHGGEGEPFGVEPFTMEGLELGPMNFEGMELGPFEWHFDGEAWDGEGIDVEIPAIRIPSFEIPSIEIPSLDFPGFEGTVPRMVVRV